ncbi:unnamed protein product [Microthlaspi erraticum]|uniref:Uncharacterized protein n=1 Tax=Microthlaspi erraticum TaxID=1685480 RepID=A0A6D2K0K7_9BRAS|nr:unnamed protein product [Microthlaspi erraticum]
MRRPSREERPRPAEKHRPIFTRPTTAADRETVRPRPFRPPTTTTRLSGRTPSRPTVRTPRSTHFYSFLASCEREPPLCMTRRSNKDNLVEHPEIDKLEKHLGSKKPKRWPTKQLALTPLKWRALKKKEEIHLLLLIHKTLLEM